MNETKIIGATISEKVRTVNKAGALVIPLKQHLAKHYNINAGDIVEIKIVSTNTNSEKVIKEPSPSEATSAEEDSVSTKPL